MDDQNNSINNQPQQDDDFVSLGELLEKQNQIPSGPEGMPIAAETSFPKFETAPANEKLVSLENLKAPEPLSRKENTAAQDDTLQAISVNKPIQPKVVDKTDEITSLHHLNQVKDALTEEADKEEEHFIEEVEKRHDKPN